MATIQEALEKGWQLQRSGQFAAAEEVYRRIVDAKPDYAEALYLLGTVCQLQEKFDDAIQHLLTAVSLKPDYAEAHNNLGVVLAAMGRRIDAVAHFRHVARLCPTDPDAANNLGNALREQGELEEAEERLRNALRLRPDFPAALHNLGLTLDAQGRVAESIAMLEQAVRLRPDFANAQADLQMALAKRSRRLGNSGAPAAIAIEVSPGELLDKITILQIKAERIADPAKLRNVHAELERLSAARDQALPASEQIAALVRELKGVNEAIWDVEDALRICERQQQFDARFIEMARSVYRNNDRRAAIKRQIDERYAAQFAEEKEYPSY